MVRFIGVKANDCPQLPGVSSTTRWLNSVQPCPLGPKEAPRVQKPCAVGWTSAGHRSAQPWESRVQLSPCPHLANVVSVPSCLLAGLALLHPGLSLEFRGCYGERMHKWADACYPDRPWVGFVYNTSAGFFSN